MTTVGTDMELNDLLDFSVVSVLMRFSVSCTE